MGEKFEKMGNVPYIFWIALAHGGNPGLIKQPTRVFRYAYIGDLLVVRAFTFEPSVTVRDELHFVTPVYRDATAEEQSWGDHPEIAPVPSLDARWLCNSIVTTLPNGEVTTLTLVCLKAVSGRRVCSIELKFRARPAEGRSTLLFRGSPRGDLW